MRHPEIRPTATASLRRLSLAAASLALCASFALGPGVASAAGIYVIDSRIDRDGASALAPTFITTPGERALVAYEGERDIEVAMTVLPREGTGAEGALAVRIELIENMEVSDARLDVTLGRPGTVTLGEREISVLVREQTPLSGTAPESDATGADAVRDAEGAEEAGSDGTGASADEPGSENAAPGDGAEGGAEQEPTSGSSADGG